MKRWILLSTTLLASSMCIAAECRCLNETELINIEFESAYVPAPCPSVVDESPYIGESTPMWFNSIPVESLYGMLGALSERKVCLSSEVRGNVYVKSRDGGEPWTAIARSVAARYGYRIWISKDYIFVSK